MELHPLDEDFGRSVHATDALNKVFVGLVFRNEIGRIRPNSSFLDSWLPYWHTREDSASV